MGAGIGPERDKRERGRGEGGERGKPQKRRVDPFLARREKR